MASLLQWLCRSGSDDSGSEWSTSSKTTTTYSSRRRKTKNRIHHRRHRISGNNDKSVWRDVAFLLILASLAFPNSLWTILPVTLSAKVEGRRCRSMEADSELTLVQQLQTAQCIPCQDGTRSTTMTPGKTFKSKDELLKLLQDSNVPNAEQLMGLIVDHDSTEGDGSNLPRLTSGLLNLDDVDESVENGRKLEGSDEESCVDNEKGGDSSLDASLDDITASISIGEEPERRDRRRIKDQFHFVVLLMGIPRLEKVLVLMTELIDRGHFITVITTQMIPAASRLHEILRQHIPCDRNIMHHLHVETININEGRASDWPCQPLPMQSFRPQQPAKSSNQQNQEQQGSSGIHGFDPAYSDGNVYYMDEQHNYQKLNRQHFFTYSQNDSTGLLRCNALHAAGLQRKLSRIIKAMNLRPDAMVADSTLLAGLIVAEAFQIPCLTLVDDEHPAGSALKWTHPHIYEMNAHPERSSSINPSNNNPNKNNNQNRGVWKLQLKHWWEQFTDQVGMTRAFMAYNAVRRRLHLQPRYQILDFWKTTVLWTPMTNHLDRPPMENNPIFTPADSMEKEAVLVDFRAYLYSKTGIGIGTSASKGNSLPLISLPEPSVPPCQPCAVYDDGDEEEEASGLTVSENDKQIIAENSQQCELIEQPARHGQPSRITFKCQDQANQHKQKPLFGVDVTQLPPEDDPNAPIQFLLPYYSHSNSLADRKRFRKLMRALVLLRDSLLAWPKCTNETITQGVSCWSSQPQFTDFLVIRLGTSHEAFVPSILKHVGVPFLDAVARHKSVSGLILPHCKTSSYSSWMQDLSIPTLCLPEGDSDQWSVRDLALRIGRLMRKMEQAKRRGEPIPSFEIQRNDLRTSNGSRLTFSVKKKQNAHTLFGTTIEKIASIVEMMGHIKRESQHAWESGDDMAWDVWLRLGLVRHPSAALSNTSSSGEEIVGWLRGILVLVSWFVVVSATIYLFVRDRQWFSSWMNTFTRRRRLNKGNGGIGSRGKESEDDEGDADDDSDELIVGGFVLSALAGADMYGIWKMSVAEMLSRLPELDRLIDMWKEWAAEESEQLNQLLFSYLDEPNEQDNNLATGRRQPGSQDNRKDGRDLASSNGFSHTNQHNGSKHHSGKKKSSRRKH